MLLALALLLMAALLPVSAGSGTFSIDLTCSGFVSNGSEMLLTRDNTGALSEAFVVTAIDGAGNNIFAPVSDVFYVGGTIVWPDGDTYEWTRAPLYNPLRLRVISLAGNGLPEMVVYEASADCAGLSPFGRIDVDEAFARERLLALPGEAFVLQPADGETSETVPLNAAPPRPINPAWLTAEQPGFAVVNTDNLHLRSGDSYRFAPVGVIDGGTELVVLGRNADRTWWYVQVGGLRGWVSAEFLILRGDLTGIPEVPVLGEYTEPSFFLFIEQPLMALPLSGSPALCALPGNLAYPVVGRDAGSTWFEVAAACDGVETSGWLMAEQGAIRNPAGVFIPVTY
jgi:hypothetical protein